MPDTLKLYKRIKNVLTNRGLWCNAKLAKKLKDLQEQKRRIEADAIMDAYLKSGKTLDEIMTFLKP